MNPNDNESTKPTEEPTAATAEEVTKTDSATESPEVATSEAATSEATTTAPATEPATPAAQAPAPTASAEHTPNAAGTIVLQWLTYAFWGWLILGLIWIMSVILINQFLNERVSDVVPYAIAATLVMLPLAFFTDRAYRKREPIKKAGGASVVMVIHAVLFALLGIGTLIASVFLILNLAINARGDNDGQIVAILTTAFAALLYAAAFLRTLNPFKSHKPLKIFSWGMAGVSIVLLAFAVIGPVVSSVAARNDQRLEEHLPSVDYAIRDYVQQQGTLPTSLSDITVENEEGQALIDEGLVTYRNEGSQVISSRANREMTSWRYQLCADFTAKGDVANSQSAARDTYASYLRTQRHEDGNHCFKLAETVTETGNTLQ